MWLNGLLSLNCPFPEEKDKIACEDPPLVENGAPTSSATIHYSGDKVAYGCGSGYHLRGSEEITCTRGKWTLPPECVGMYATLESVAKPIICDFHFSCIHIPTARDHCLAELETYWCHTYSAAFSVHEVICRI